MTVVFLKCALLPHEYAWLPAGCGCVAALRFCNQEPHYSDKKDAATPLSSTHNHSAAPQCDFWMTSSSDEHPAASGSFVTVGMQKKQRFGDGVKLR